MAHGYLSSQDWTTFNAKQAGSSELTGLAGLGSLGFVRRTGAGTYATVASLDLTNSVTGVLPIANGGTGQTTQTAAFDALSPLTTKGDIVVNNGANDIRLAVGADGLVLKANSATASGLEWAAGSTTSADVSAAGGFLQSGNSFGATAVLGTNDAQSLQFETGGTTKMTVLASGDVGIGTTTPGQKLTVAGVIESNTGGFRFPDGTTQTTASTSSVGTCTVILTSGTSWTVPTDWNSTNNTIEVIGGGGGYSKITNLSLTVGASITYQIGSGGAASTAGGNTWFNGASFGVSSVGAVGGGAAGPNGAGLTGNITNGGAGDNGIGGAGGTAGVAGSAGNQWGTNIGPGGGGGRGTTSTGAAGGLYGGGGGGAGGNNGAGSQVGGAGASGIIVISYTSSNCAQWATGTGAIYKASGNVGIGTASPAGALDVVSTTGALIPPRMTTAQRDALASPQDGSVVYNTTTNKVNFRENASWVEPSNGVSAVTTASCVVGAGSSCSVNCPATYYRTGCSADGNGAAFRVYPSGAGCGCTDPVAVGGTCYAYCAK